MDDTHLLCRLMEALDQQLQQLNKELDALQPHLEQARSAYAGATGTEQVGVMKDIWEHTAKKEEILLQQRQSLYDKLKGTGATAFLDC